MHHHVAAKFFAEGPPAQTVGFTGGAVDAVGQFNDSDDGERRINFSVCGLHSLKNLPHTFSRPLPRDQDAGVENYSHLAELRGLRWPIISARSAAKSGSRVGSCPSSFACASANAIDSERGRPCNGSAEWTTATGRASRSMITSTPARTRASTPAKSPAASASEM